MGAKSSFNSPWRNSDFCVTWSKLLGRSKLVVRSIPKTWSLVLLELVSGSGRPDPQKCHTKNRCLG